VGFEREQTTMIDSVEVSCGRSGGQDQQTYNEGHARDGWRYAFQRVENVLNEGLAQPRIEADET
jgi:hypothetical protein